VLAVTQLSQKENSMQCHKGFNANDTMTLPQALKSGTAVRHWERNVFTTADKLEAVLKWSNHDLETGRWRKLLYRFLTDHVPGSKLVCLDLGAPCGGVRAFQSAG
jgi:hypothetical protein